MILTHPHDGDVFHVRVKIDQNYINSLRKTDEVACRVWPTR